MSAMAAAQHAAWEAAPELRRSVFTDTLRKLLGPKQCPDAVLSPALLLFDRQAAPPAGFHEPPENAHFTICPRCQHCSALPHVIPPNGRVRMNALRDKAWLERQFSKGLSTRHIANRLKCSPQSVIDWARKHDLGQYLKQQKVHDEDVVRLHAAGEAPGRIAELLRGEDGGFTASDVKRILSRLGVATSKEGHHHYRKEWWVERLVNRQMTLRDCAREVGIVSHAASYYAKKFGLQEHSAARSCRVTRKRARYKYPQLTDPKQLRALVEQHGSWVAVARAIGAPDHSATNVRAWWEEHFGKEPPPLSRASKLRQRAGMRSEPHHQRAWWEERLERGETILQMAEEAGLDVKSAAEHLRRLGTELLAKGYANNTRAERAKRATTIPAQGGDTLTVRVIAADDLGHEALLVIDPPREERRPGGRVATHDQVYARQHGREAAVRRFGSIAALVGQVVTLVFHTDTATVANVRAAAPGEVPGTGHARDRRQIA